MNAHWRQRVLAALRGTQAASDPVADAMLGIHRDISPEEAGIRRDAIRQAAVLLPIVVRGDEASLLFTQRTDHLPEHPGQVSFPGGSLEPGDADSVACALRETQEETGIAPTQVAVAGFLDTYLTITGYAVTPVVGFVKNDFILRPDPFEVEAVFEVPLPVILARGSLRTESRALHGRDVQYYVLDYNGYRIWGATAAMLADFRNRMLQHEALAS